MNALVFGHFYSMEQTSKGYDNNKYNWNRKQDSSSHEKSDVPDRCDYRKYNLYPHYKSLTGLINPTRYKKSWCHASGLFCW